MNALFRAREYKDALVKYEEAIRLDPTNPLSHINIVKTLNQLQFYQEALTVVNEALRLNLDSGGVQWANDVKFSALNGRGDIESRAGHHEAALAKYTEAAIFSPTNPVAHINKAAMLNRLGRYDDALAAIRSIKT